MQTLAGQNRNSLSKQSRKVALIAILLFALSGLISGFAVGAFVRPRLGTGTSPTGSGTTPVGQITKTANPTNQPHPVRFNAPSIDHFDSLEKADGSSFYTFSAHLDTLVDKNGIPIRASDLTCKLWLIPRVPSGDIIVYPPPERLKDVNTLSNLINSEAAKKDGEIIPGISFPEIQGFNFDNTTQQIQPCTTYDQVTWKYQISTSVAPGDYDLIVLYDWQGIHYNWSWAHIEIK